MAKLKKEDVLHVAKLAKLDLSSQEIDKFTSQLSSVLDHFDELSQVETEDVAATSQTTGQENIARKDVAANSLTQDEALSGSEKIYNGYFKVDAILSERTDK